MNQKLKEKVFESLSAVLPITGIVLALSIFLVPLDVGTVVMFTVGAIMLIFGMGLFQLGAEISMTPLGDGIGVQMTKFKHIITVAVISLAMGVIITIAEPDLQVLAEQVPSIDNMTLILTVAIGVGIFLAMAVLRIIWKIDLSILLMGMYVVLMTVSFFVPKEFLAVAFDSGGVTTGPITVPFIMAMGVGISSMRNSKNSSDDSFGLIAMSSGGPILAVLILGLFVKGGVSEHASEAVPTVGTMRDVVWEFAIELPNFFKEVLITIFPIVVVYILFQLISRHYQKTQRRRIAVGFVYTFLGLVLFLCGVNVGFAPVGTLLGRELAKASYKWILIPIGMLIGYFIVKAEPAIQVLNAQVQSVTSGTISSKSMNRALQIGVSASVGLAMLRVLTGIPIYYIVIPGYVIALVMSIFVPKIFVGIAFDSGGVASGPMTSTFLLPLCIGACEMVEGGNVMTDAFGAVALVALTPLIAIQIMGLQYRFKTAKLEKSIEENAVHVEISDEIIEFEEETGNGDE